MSTHKKFITLFPLFLLLIIETMSFGVIFPVLGPLFLDKTGAIVDPSTSLFLRQLFYGLSLGIFSFTMLLGAPVLGDISDRWGRKKVLIAALLGSAVGLVICALGIEFNSVLILIVGRFVGGFFAGSQPIAQAAIADISTKEDKAINMGYIIFANCIGFIIGPIFGGYFADADTFTWSTYATPFYGAAILTVINAIMVSRLFKETHVKNVTSRISLLRGVTIFIEAFQHKNVRMLSIITFISEMGWSMFFLYLTLFLVEKYHFSGVDIGHYMAFYGLVWAITLTVIVRIVVKYFKVETIVWQSLYLYGAAMLLMLVPNETVLWLAVIPIGIPSSLQYAGIVTVFSNAVDEDAQGWVMGINSAVLAAAWGIGGVLAGLISAYGVYLPFIIGAILTFISGTLMMFYSKED